MVHFVTQLTTFGRLLDTDPTGTMDIPHDFWGLGGAHGGLAVALTTAHLAELVPAEARLRSVSAHLLSPIREPLPIMTRIARRGRSSSTAVATVGVNEPALTATAIFSTRRHGSQVGPARPDVVRPSDAEPIQFPVELVPIAQHTEIRAVGPDRPFAGGDDPSLTAWIRLLGDAQRPDALRLVAMLDALAPSQAAVLTAPVAIPTVEYAVHLSGAAGTDSPWVLVSANTVAVSTDGWLTEHLNAWSEDGTHLGSARQLRVVAGRA